MPSTSQQQQKLFGLALSVKRGDTPRSEVSDDVLNIVDTMSEKDIKDFAETSHSGLPKKIESYVREFVRETFRNKILGEVTRRSKDFFEDDNKYGIELHKLLRGKWDRDKVLQYFIKLQSSAKDKYQNVLYFIANGLGINGRSYKNTVDLRDDIITAIGNLYTLHTESVNEAPTQKSNNFFKVNKHGYNIHNMLDGKWDKKKVEKYFDSLKSSESGHGGWFSHLKGTAESVGVDPYKYRISRDKLVDAIIDGAEKLYKIHTESVNESDDLSTYKSVVDILKTLHNFSDKIKFRTQYVNGYHNIVYDDPNQITKNYITALKNRKFWNTKFEATTTNSGDDRINIYFEKPAQEILNIVDFDKKNWTPNKIEESEQLDEKLITFSNRAPYGQVVFIAGGAGSGKGFAIEKFMDSFLFKVRDVDEMKKQLQALNAIGKLSIQQIIDKYGNNIKPVDLEAIKKIQNDGFDLKTMDLKKPDHVYALHILVKAAGINDKTLANTLASAKNPEVLPNIMFDITAKEIADITDTIPKLLQVGYKPENIHLVWVLTNYQIAIKANQERDRVVPDDILLKTHIGAGNTIWGIVTKALPKGMNGRVDVILNNRENTIPQTDKSGKNILVQPRGKKKPDIVVKSFLSLPIKKQGGPILPEKLWKDVLFNWIKDNAPEELTSNM